VTLYNQVTGSINDLRGDLVRLGEARAELGKKEDFSGRITSIWNSIKELQTTQVLVQGLKERPVVRDQARKHETTRWEVLAAEVQALKEAVTALKERTLVHEQQLKDAEEKKALMRELQGLRERLAGLEGRQTGSPIKPAVHRSGD